VALMREGRLYTVFCWGNLRTKATWRKWEDDIKMGVRCDSTDWTDQAQDRDRWQALLNAVMKFLVP
jgi:hypothetical protein